MIFSSPGPIFLELGPISLRWYGLLYALALLATIEVAQRINKENDISKDDISNFFITALVTGLIGARLWFVALNLDYFTANPLEILQIWLGGQSIQGGIVGAALGTWIFYKKNYLYKLSLAATVMPLAQAIGRWGNFFNEEAYGKVCNLPWKLYISHTGQYHHPTFLYESLWNLLVFGILLNFFSKGKCDEGCGMRVIGLYILLYSLGRLLIEPLRLDSLYLGDYPAASVFAVIGIVLGVLMVKNHQSDGGNFS